MDFLLKEFLEIKTCPFEFYGQPEILQKAAAGFSIDSRTIKSGEVFFAIKGETHDGHDFVEEVLQKKALALVVEKSWLKKQPNLFQEANIFVVEDTLKALQETAHFYREKFDIPVLGLTGTNGKTTTKEMIAAVLSQSGEVCKTWGNLNNHIGVPLTLFSLKKNHKALVLEMGTNHFGEITRLCEIGDPQYGLITNVGRGHLEFFGDVEGVARAKMELFDYLSPDGIGFVNLEDKHILKKTPPLKKRITYGFTDTADIQGHLEGLDTFGFPRLRVEETRITIPIPGQHNALNALAAVAVGLEFGVSLAKIKEALEQVHVPDKRMQIFTRAGVVVLNDAYNANPDSTKAALEVLNSIPAKGKRIFVFGDMLELGETAQAEHEKIGELLKNYPVDVFFAYGEFSHFAVKKVKQQSKMRAEHFTNKTDLQQALKNLLQPGDVLLVKGSRGMKMEEVLDGIW